MLEAEGGLLSEGETLEDPILSWVFPLGILPSSNGKDLRKIPFSFQLKEKKHVHFEIHPENSA